MDGGKDGRREWTEEYRWLLRLGDGYLVIYYSVLLILYMSENSHNKKFKVKKKKIGVLFKGTTLECVKGLVISKRNKTGNKQEHLYSFFHRMRYHGKCLSCSYVFMYVLPLNIYIYMHIFVEENGQ